MCHEERDFPVDVLLRDVLERTRKIWGESFGLDYMSLQV